MDGVDNEIKRRPGRKALLTAEHSPVLVAIAQESPRSSLDELTREFNRRTGLNLVSVQPPHLDDRSISRSAG